MRKPVFRVSDQVRHKPGRTMTDGQRLETSDLRSRRILLSMKRKTKALIVVTAQFICTYVFAYMLNAGFLITRLRYKNTLLCQFDELCH